MPHIGEWFNLESVLTYEGTPEMHQLLLTGGPSAPC